MSIERLKSMKDCFMTAVESQMYNLNEVDAEELGEVVDMIKDLSEAVYYCSITEAMEKADKDEEKMYYSPDKMYYRGQPRDSMGRYTSYYSEGGGRSGSSSSSSSGNSSGGTGNGTSYYTEREMNMPFMDGREGKSPQSRRMYMEAKETKQGKTAQMKELEHYMQELAQDLMEMIEDASPEEKTYMAKKMSVLATKINQTNTSAQHDSN